VPLLTSRDAWTELSGVANTLLLGPEGGRHGLNTDIPGAEAALAQATGATLRSALVIGGGATAASVGLALCERGLERVTLVVRDPARASDTVAALARHPRRPTVTLSEFGGLGRARADVVVSTVPAAAQTDELLGAVGEIEVVFDVLYDPWPTPLAAAGLSRGHTVVGGLDLLVWQAVDQVRAMTGRFDVPVAAMRHAAEAALAARQRSAGR
jgi:shikimate dehydrogenase